MTLRKRGWYNDDEKNHNWGFFPFFLRKDGDDNSVSIIDRVKFDGLRSRDWLIYKHPSDKLVNNTQLVVGEGQMAIFVKEGQVCDSFSPGTYPLATHNLPVLNKVFNLPYGGDTPFTAEIYYLNQTAMLNLRWGTVDPVPVVDPKYFIKLRVRAFGQFGLKIEDPTVFLRELIGTMGLGEIIQYDKVISFFKGILMTKIKTAIADLIINQKVSALDITARLDEISQLLAAEISEGFLKYGLRIVNFFSQSINFPETDFAQINQILADRAAFELMGEQRYATKRTFDIYEGAANNDSGVAGALVAGGLGLSAGARLGESLQPGPALPSGQQIGGKCYQCGAALPSTGRFCPECGAAQAVEGRKCPQCQAVLPVDARFCSLCGAVIGKKCPCGAELDPDARFCPECGQKVGE